MTDFEKVILLERMLSEVLTNLQEDVPIDQWSRHLEDSVRDAYEYLSGEKK